MKLLRELSTLKEGQMKDAMMSIIDKALSSSDLSGLDYEAAVQKIIKKSMELDHNNLLAGSNNAELAEYVKQQFDEDDFNSLKEAEEMPDDTVSDEDQTNEKIIGKADEFKVVLNMDTEMVDILDGEDTVRLTMPKVIWDQLKRQ